MRRRTEMSEISWGIMLVGYLFLGGAAGGAYAVGGLADLFKGEDKKYRILSKSGVLVSLFAMIIGLVLLVVDLKRFAVDPLVILNAYLRFPGSILTVGTWIITAFIAVSLLTVILGFFKGDATLRKGTEIVGIVLGISTAAYTGILLSFARGIPLWSSAFLPWLFVISGALTGLALTMIMIPALSVIMPSAFRDFKELYENKDEFVSLLEHTEKYCQILTVIEIILVAIYLISTPMTGVLLGGSSVSLWFYVYIVLGLILPLGVSYYTTKLADSGKTGTVILMTMGGHLLVLFGGLLLRYVILTGGQIIF
jgi:formate-dependent nitrite reductase membrane component NrfD